MSSTGTLVCNNNTICRIQVATTRSERRRGLSGREHYLGAFALAAKSVHTVGMKFTMSAAFCAQDGEVLKILTLPPNRVSRIVWRAVMVVEAEAVTFGQWGIHVGDFLEIR